MPSQTPLAPSRMTRRHGFTLIELLVVISIIALLVAILLPALGAARESATQILCGSRQKSVAAATHMYLTDFKQFFPLHWDGTSIQPDWTSAWDELNTYLGVPWRQPGGIYMSSTVLFEGWRCPKLDEIRNRAASPATASRGAIFSPNPNIIGYFNANGVTFATYHWSKYPNQRIHEAHLEASPSNTIMWGETITAFRPLQKSDYNGRKGAGWADGWGYAAFPHFSQTDYQFDPGPATQPWFSTHTGRTAVGFVDGHVGTHAPADFPTNALEFDAYVLANP